MTTPASPDERDYVAARYGSVKYGPDVPAGPDAGRGSEYEALLERVARELYQSHFGSKISRQAMAGVVSVVKSEADATLAAVADLIDGWAADESNWYLTSDHYRAIAARLRGLVTS